MKKSELEELLKIYQTRFAAGKLLEKLQKHKSKSNFILKNNKRRILYK
jgi:hypothetical protein